MTKAPTHTEKYKKQRDNTKRNQKLRLHNDCGPIFSWVTSNDSHSTVVVEPVSGIPNPHLPQKLCNQRTRI